MKEGTTVGAIITFDQRMGRELLRDEGARVGGRRERGGTRVLLALLT